MNVIRTFKMNCHFFYKHVPVKTMYRKQNQVHYINRELQKVIYEKKMYYSNFLIKKTQNMGTI